jgi:hypothetical protein
MPLGLFTSFALTLMLAVTCGVVVTSESAALFFDFYAI